MFSFGLVNGGVEVKLDPYQVQFLSVLSCWKTIGIGFMSFVGKKSDILPPWY